MQTAAPDETCVRYQLVVVDEIRTSYVPTLPFHTRYPSKIMCALPDRRYISSLNESLVSYCRYAHGPRCDGKSQCSDTSDPSVC